MEHSSVSGVEESAVASNVDSVALSHNEKENRSQTGPAHGGPPVQPMCRFYSQGRHCNFGRKCRFLHQRGDANLTEGKLENRTNQSSEQDNQKGTGHSNSGGTQENTVFDSPGDEGRRLPSNAMAAPPRRERANRRPCRYFLSGFCTMEDKCRYWHPEQFHCVDQKSVLGDGGSRRPTVHAPCPSVPQEVRLSDLTDDITKQLRDTEIKQMVKRFPKEQLIVQERSDGQVTYYRVAVEATDPDWPFDLKEVDIMVSFPEKYPQEVFTLDIPEDQDLPSVMGRYLQQASLEWLQAKHATNQLMGKVELLFRPFLRWLDRSMERLFTEAARQLKKDIEIARSGIQFVPYQQLQATVCKEPATCDTTGPVTCTATDEESKEEGEEEENEGAVKAEEVWEQEEEEEEEEGCGLVDNIKSSEPRRGTEMKLLGLRLGEGTATVVAREITVCLQCNKCKVTADLTLSGRLTCTAQCEKCNAGISAAFRPGMLHQYSDVLGYLDLVNAAPVDLVLQDCELVVGCLSCSQEGPVQNILYGRSREINCQHCHSKLSILVDSTRFQYIQPRSKDKTGLSDSALSYRRTIRDPAVQLGKPLPEKGACKHYKQSHRWLRFSCCGRAYPCDVCHDEDQDHSMELATRMICGHCAKEQPYSNGKPCVSCGGMMTRGAHTSHWEGGLGCRSKVKMSRNDRHKYANSNKTISRKATSEKK